MYSISWIDAGMMAAEEARMCTSYEANPNDAWDVFSLFPVPDFDYRP